LGEGTFIVHIDAVHRGLIKTRKIVTFKADSHETHLDFTLRHGVTVAGKFVDQHGNPWNGGGYGSGHTKRGNSGVSTSSCIYGNKYAPKHIREGLTTYYMDGEGDVLRVRMVFPSKSSFLLPAMVPGETTIDFRPRGAGERVQKMLYQGQDISKTGLTTEAGQRIDGITIVVGTSARR
jgi:hypothetical protein